MDRSDYQPEKKYHLSIFIFYNNDLSFLHGYLWYINRNLTLSFTSKSPMLIILFGIKLMLNKYLLKEYILICISGFKSVMDLELEFMSFSLESLT